MPALFEDMVRDLVVATGVCSRRVFVLRAPQNPAEQLRVPYCIVTPTGPEPLHSLAGPLSVQIRNYQLAIFDESQSKALGLADDLRQGIDGYRGDFEGWRIGAILFRRQTVHYEPDTRLFEVMPEYRISAKHAPVIRTYEPLRKGLAK